MVAVQEEAELTRPMEQIQIYTYIDSSYSCDKNEG